MPICFEKHKQKNLSSNSKWTEYLPMKGNLHFIDLSFKETGNVPTYPPFALKWI